MIDVTLLHLNDFERWLKNMQLQIDSKQSTRIFSNNVWLRDHLDSQLKNHLEPTRTYLKDIQKETHDNALAINISASIKYCDELIKLLQQLSQIHKLNPSDVQARNQWVQTLPGLFTNVNHLRNRLTIANSLLKNTREREKDAWLNEL